SEEAALRAAAEKAGARRAEVQRARRAVEGQTLLLLHQNADLMSSEAARLSEFERQRQEMEERHQREQAELELEIERLNQATQQVVGRRASIAVATQEAETENRNLVEAQARMESAEHERQLVEAERLKIEAQILQSLEAERLLLEDTRARVSSLDNTVNPTQFSQDYEQQLADFAEFRSQQELEQQRRDTVEQEIHLEIEKMAEAESEARRRIEHAELRRRAAEEACRQAEEKALKVEIESHQRVLEERKSLAKLEAAQRDAAADAQTRSAQENRIRE